MLLKERFGDTNVKAANALGNLAYLEIAITKATYTLGLLSAAAGEEERAQIVQAGALKPLVTQLKQGSDYTKTWAAYALWNLAVDSENRSSQIVNAAALQPLVMMLQEGSDAADKHALNALAHLSKWKALRKQIFDAGALKPLVILQTVGSSLLKAAAESVLTALTSNHAEYQELITEVDSSAYFYFSSLHAYSM